MNTENKSENWLYTISPKKKLVDFILESRKLVDLVNDENFDKVKKFVEECSLLFKGPCGVRHVDFIAHKEV